SPPMASCWPPAATTRWPGCGTCRRARNPARSETLWAGTTSAVAVGLPRPLGSTIGTLTIHGNYTQLSGSLLIIKVGGTDDGQYDQLLIDGIASLGGTLQVTWAGGFTGAGSTAMLQILHMADSVGRFAQENFRPLSGGLGMETIYDDADVWLSLFQT